MLLGSIKAWKKDTVTLSTGIGGIEVESGHKCIECRHSTPIWESMTEHFHTKHEGKDAKECTEGNIQMQALFSGELKKWFEIADQNVMDVNEENGSAWEVIKVFL